MSDLTSAIVETLDQPVLVLEEDLCVAAANRAFLECFQVSSDATVKSYIFDLGNGQWNIPELRKLLTKLLDGRDEIKDYRVEYEFEAIGQRTMLLNARKLGQEGHNRILLVINDVTERERKENELIARQEFADKLIDSIREGLVVMQPDLKVERVNQSFCEMFQVDPQSAIGRKIYDLGNGQWDIPELRRALEEILPKRHAFDDFEVTHHFPEIGRRTMLLNARQLDHMPRILLAIRDETEQLQHAANQKLMVGELQHRVKNILANVQSIATATLRRSSNLGEFKTAFLDRLQSLSRAQDLLMRGPRGEADLRDVIVSEFTARGMENDDRIAIRGPSITLRREQTQAIAMVLHELTTNAVKYGAFSNAAGELAVIWTVEDTSWLQLEWRESGVAIGQPGKSGFGTGMIKNSISHSLGGESTLEFARDGVRCQIRLPLHGELQGAA